MSLEGYVQQREFSFAADIQDIYYCFRLILGRNPNLEECKGHSGMSGNDLTQVVKSYVQSLEFQNRNLFSAQAMNIATYTIENFQMVVDLNDRAVGVPISNSSYEPHVTNIFKKYLKKGMRVLDIGANIGYFSMLAANLVGTNGKVFAIEPNMDNCKLLQASKNLNKFEQIKILQFAAGLESGLLALNTSYSNGTTSDLSSEIKILMQSKIVPAIKIDDMKEFDAGVDFIKIDIEGAEYNALAGARELIGKYKPLIVSEFSPTIMPGISHVDGRTYLKFLISMGYDIHVLNFDGSIQENKSDIEKTMRAFDAAEVDHIDIMATPI